MTEYHGSATEWAIWVGQCCGLVGGIRKPNLLRPESNRRVFRILGPPGRHAGGPVRLRHGSNPDFPPSRVFCRLLKLQPHEPPSSQESQAPCTKSVQNIGQLTQNRKTRQRES